MVALLAKGSAGDFVRAPSGRRQPHESTQITCPAAAGARINPPGPKFLDASETESR